MKFFTLFFLLILNPVQLMAEDGYLLFTGGHFMSGNSYMDLSEDEKEIYVAGLSDALSISDIKSTKTKKSELNWYINCSEEIKKMKLSQLTAIMNKHLKEHPENWHLSSAVLFRAAMSKVCF